MVKTEKILWKKKYITVLMLSLLILAAVLYGIRNDRRNDNGGNILAGASPDTSALQMYYFDGETVVVRTLYDSGTEKEVIKKINVIPLLAAEEDALSQMEPPFTGSGSAVRMALIFPWRPPAVSGLRMTGRFIMGIRICLFYGNRWKARMRIPGMS